MNGFYGMLDGEIITDAMEFVIKARDSYEEIPKEAKRALLSGLSVEQKENGLFTKKEIALMDGYSAVKGTKVCRVERDAYQWE